MIATALAAARVALEPYLAWIRLIAVIAAAFAFTFAYLQVKQWREDSHQLAGVRAELKAARAELEQHRKSATAAALAYTAALNTAEATAAVDRAIAQEIHRDLKTKLDAADGRGRDLARRLRDYEVRRCGVQAAALAGAATVSTGPSGEPGDPEAVERATGAHFAACDRDALRLDGWREWWTRTCRNWRERGFPVEACP